MPLRIDSHQHFWRYIPAEFAWIDDRMRSLRADHLPLDLEPILQAAKVDGTIAVQARPSLQETQWLLRQADLHPWIRGVVGWFDLCSPLCAHQLDSFAKDPRLCGVRHPLQDEPVEFALRPDFQRGIALLARRRLAYDLLVRPPQMPAAVRLCRAFPEQTFVLDHCGKPALRSGEVAGWLEPLRELARLPNVYCKISGLVTEADWQQWRPDELRRTFATVLEAFGPSRLLFGSDWPVCLLASTYQRWVDVVLSWLGTVSSKDRDAILGGNALRVYRLAGADAAAS